MRTKSSLQVLNLALAYTVKPFQRVSSYCGQRLGNANRCKIVTNRSGHRLLIDSPLVRSPVLDLYSWTVALALARV